MTRSSIGDDPSTAARVLRDGGIIGLPTETVYGLGAMARDVAAVERVFRTKGRPSDHPLIVHVYDIEAAREWAKEWPTSAEILAEKFWPGPLTLIVDRADFVPDVVTGGQSTVALRVPGHRMALEVLRLVGDGVAAPSANRFGGVSPTTASHVLDDLDGRVDYVLDGGPCGIGLESTIVDCTVHPPRILRPGGVPREAIDAVVRTIDHESSDVRAPGMLASHYAPKCRIHLFEPTQPVAMEELGPNTLFLDAALDPSQFASEMYTLLRRADDAGVSDLYVRLPPTMGIGVAIRDRLTKAAFRDETAVED